MIYNWANDQINQVSSQDRSAYARSSLRRKGTAEIHDYTINYWNVAEAQALW